MKKFSVASLGIEPNSMKLLMFTVLSGFSLGLLAVNTHISPNGDAKNTISVIKSYIKNDNKILNVVCPISATNPNI